VRIGVTGVSPRFCETLLVVRAEGGLVAYCLSSIKLLKLIYHSISISLVELKVVFHLQRHSRALESVLIEYFLELSLNNDRIVILNDTFECFESVQILMRFTDTLIDIKLRVIDSYFFLLL
jgi:hypothetical protein